MKNYSIRPYQYSDFDNWNAFIARAKNATFLFHRSFMEYHKDRFEDFSLLVFEAEKLIAVLPANKTENKIFSHQGLTYGGLIYDERMKLATVITVFKEILSFLDAQNIERLHLKLIPLIYYIKPAQDMDYALFLAEAKLVRRDTLSVIDLSKKSDLSEIRKRGIRKGAANQLLIKEETGFEAFWKQILIPNLKKKHKTKPVHTVEEIAMLKSRFPKNIRQFNVYFKDEIVAGTTIFETDTVAHAQYISANEIKNELGSLDYLYHYLLTEVFSGKAYFDFGISNENGGKKLNSGLSYWKESFGAGTILHDFYEVDTINYKLLEDVLL